MSRIAWALLGVLVAASLGLMIGGREGQINEARRT